MRKIPPPWCGTPFEQILRRLKPLASSDWAAYPEEFWSLVYGEVTAYVRGVGGDKPGGLYRKVRRERSRARRLRDAAVEADAAAAPTPERLAPARIARAQAEALESLAKGAPLGAEGLNAEDREFLLAELARARKRQPAAGTARLRWLIELVSTVTGTPHYAELEALIGSARGFTTAQRLRQLRPRRQKRM